MTGWTSAQVFQANSDAQAMRTLDQPPKVLRNPAGINRIFPVKAHMESDDLFSPTVYRFQGRHVNTHGTLGDSGVTVPNFIARKEAVIAYGYTCFKERVYVLGKQVECLRSGRVL
jgi:hypothetical protein